MPMLDILQKQDPEIALAIQAETKRQAEHLELIASENYVSPAVLAAQGSILTNKYAEGYPGRRYYGGCEHVDTIERLAIARAKTLFNAPFANVQPHSGSQANYATLSALLNPNDTILSMNLNAGGHLTHGSPASFAGKLYHIVHYGLHPQSELIDFAEVRSLALKHKPKLILAGFSAYSRILDWQLFRDIADEVGAYFMVDMAHVAGLVAAGVYPSPVPLADVVTSTTHKTLRGPRGGIILSKTAEIAKKINSAVFPGQQGGPLMHVIAAKAVAFHEALQPAFKTHQAQVVSNARAMAQQVQARGYRIVSGGTDNHLFQINLIGKPITGLAAETALGQANMTVNKNSVVNDPLPYTITSGLRIGTPAITTRGLKEAECSKVANYLADVLDDHENTQTILQTQKAVLELLQYFPVP